MEHRKRHLMQHKTELSTQIKIVMATNKNLHLLRDKITDRSLVTALATEAIASLKNGDVSFFKADGRSKAFVKEGVTPVAKNCL